MKKVDIALKIIEDTQSIEVVRTWMDDHILCCAATFDGKEVEFWWTGWEMIAALTYADDSLKAKNLLLGHLTDMLETLRCMAIDAYESGQVLVNESEYKLLAIADLTLQQASELE